MISEMTERLAQAFKYAAVWYLEPTISGVELTDEEGRNVNSFRSFEMSVEDVPAALMEEMAELAKKYPDLYDNSLMTLLSSVSDTFRPATATEFVEKLNIYVLAEAQKISCPNCAALMKAHLQAAGFVRFECPKCGFGAIQGGAPA